MDEKRIKEVFADEAFVKSLFAMESPEEVQKALKDKDIEVSIEDILNLRDSLMRAAEAARKNGGELALEELDEAAGGFVLLTAAYLINTALISGPYVAPLLFSDTRSGIRW